MARGEPRVAVTPSAHVIAVPGLVTRLRNFGWPSFRLTPLRWEDPRLRILAAHLAALAAGMLIFAVQGTAPLSASDAVVATLIALGLSALRVLSVRKPLAGSTLVLDAAGTVVLLAGTNAPVSPFYILAIAGVWWAAHVPRPHSGLIYAGTFAVACALLIFPQALRTHLLAAAVEDVGVLIILAVLADRFVDIPVDVVLAAAQLGLSVVQAELLAYLVLGLTNREIGEATHVSEAAVRYRLTRLYRVLGVRRRHEAVRRALALGLSLPIDGAQSPSARG
jgi:DNA-binding CsgD family transcriptional regulator